MSSPRPHAPAPLRALLAAAALLGACGGPREPDPAGAPPSVLLVVWDTVRADRTSAYGHPVPTTPRLEALAADGVRFERAISASSWTVPGHASLFTGLPARAHGASYAYPWLNDRFETLAESLRAAGYATYAFSANLHFGPETNLAQGFDRFEHPWDERWEPRLAELGRTRPSQDKDAADVAGEALLAWLDARPADAPPFFAVLNMMEAHLPVRPSEASRAALMDEALAEASRRWDEEPPRLIPWMLQERAATPEELALVAANYDAALLDLDRRTGALLDALEERGVLDDCLVVVTSDHGENLGERGLFDHKFCLYDTLLRVPLVVRPPGGGAGRVVAETVSSQDVHATVLAAAGVAVPDSTTAPTSAGTRGRDLLAGPLEPRPVVAELRAARLKLLEREAQGRDDFDWPRWLRLFEAIEFGGEKLIRASDGGLELFRVDRDPGETEDLAGAEPARARRLAGALDDWLRGVREFDAEAEDEAGKRRVLSEEDRARLDALGYVED